MSDVNAEPGEKPEVEAGEHGKTMGAGTEASGSGAQEVSSNDHLTSSDASAASSGSPLTGAEAGELQNAAGTAPVESATGAALASVDADADKVAEVAGEAGAVVNKVEATVTEPLSLLKRVEAAALRAYQSSNTAEHNLMAWLHTHLTGANAAAAGAGALEGLTDEAKAILADLKNLL
ncbi:hypothetical protein [Trinickia mobilis]|uniref:hypothetical protein n=1 Tax=Trinickia mobilis TaxID=2816356 RepID=UPI001A8DA25A|nr:hypothetical protein [Trinickia mobilis]